MNTLAINEPQLLVLAEEDKEKGRVTHWNSVDEMFDTILGESCINLRNPQSVKFNRLGIYIF